MAGFQDLPAEIVQEIVSHLLSHRDVANLSIQCRFLHDLCDMDTRRKYRRLRITPYRKSLNGAFDRLFEILMRPALGRYVRRIEFINSPSYTIRYGDELVHERDPSPAEKQLLRTAIHSAGFTGPDIDILMGMLLPGPVNAPDWWRQLIWHRPLATNVAQVLTMLHISVSPYVESMAIPAPFEYLADSYTCGGRNTPSIVERPIKRLMRNVNHKTEGKPFLQNLRDLYILNDQGKDVPDTQYYCPLDLARCITLFQGLPAIESIATDATQEDEDSIARLQPSSSNFSKISIQSSALDSDYLITVALSCKILKEFKYSMGGRTMRDDDNTCFDPRTFIQAMLMHKGNLEVLDVDIEGSWHFVIKLTDGDGRHGIEQRFYMDDHTAAGTLPDELWEQSGSLKDFHLLKRLELGVMFLIYFAKGVNLEKSQNFKLADHLPPNLEYLVVRGYERGQNEEHDAQIDTLFALKESGSSKLKEIAGIEDMIPNAEDVLHANYDGGKDYPWEREDDEWSEEERPAQSP